ncbi:ROK family protein [Peijinzhouia sedimentorum]
MKEIAIGVDIGGTFTKFGLVDREGNVLAESSMATYKHSNPDSFVKVLFTELEVLRQPFEDQIKLMGIGIGAPNANAHKGTIEHAPNLNWKGVVPFKELLSKYYPSTQISITNDANAAALGEMVFGAANGKTDFMVVTMGTGLGSGIVSNGKLLIGHDGFAGELGHVIVVPNGRQCNCGRKGCLETYVSAPGIRRTLMELTANTTYESPLREISFIKLSAKDITEHANNGDKLALATFNKTGEILGAALANAVAFTSPEVIYLFGGLAKSGDLILEPTRKTFEQNLLNIYQGKPRIELSGIQDRSAAILGASSLVWAN